MCAELIFLWSSRVKKAYFSKVKKFLVPLDIGDGMEHCISLGMFMGKKFSSIDISMKGYIVAEQGKEHIWLHNKRELIQIVMKKIAFK